ncbi:MAG TPA: pro-sigmaK processing inhibitor BofA family protein [Candidatus Onthomonas avicola]|nr:pro-sigmaK processing inhibitor BofA family protein [Candidatus Onthomonas avicola]
MLRVFFRWSGIFCPLCHKNEKEKGGGFAVTDQVIGCLVLIALLGLLVFRRALGRLFRLGLRTAVGALVLALLAPLSGWTGLSLGVNLFNALVLGVLGVPGFGLLLLLQWAVR